MHVVRTLGSRPYFAPVQSVAVWAEDVMVCPPQPLHFA